MSDFPKAIEISEVGPREGFQIEPGPISTRSKIEVITALAHTGVKAIDVASFVNAKLVPGWADADAVVAALPKVPGVRYYATWFNAKGLERALALRNVLDVEGSIAFSASEAFSKKNLNRDRAGQLEAMREFIVAHKERGVAIRKLGVMASTGCNYAGDIPAEQVVSIIKDGLALARDEGLTIEELLLADSMGWATPMRVARLVGAVRDNFPELSLGLHLHDTHGLGIASAYEALRLGVSKFDSAVGGLGGCPFAGQPNAPGNIATEELVLLCAELGIATGIDLDAMVDVARMAERIVGHQLPSAALRTGSLDAYRAKAAA
jgi:hydroxymethylglutaryl-CoA lyase